MFLGYSTRVQRYGKKLKYQIFFNFFAKKFRYLYYRQISVCTLGAHWERAARAPNMLNFRYLQQVAPL